VPVFGFLRLELQQGLALRGGDEMRLRAEKSTPQVSQCENSASSSILAGKKPHRKRTQAGKKKKKMTSENKKQNLAKATHPDNLVILT